jgi:2-dehydro-3-deoxyphosphooctonate aldolase (KDO 8-P synthase)
MHKIEIGNVPLGRGAPLCIIAGPCVIESLDNLRYTAKTLKDITSQLNVGFVFKSSFDKANRSSASSFRGPGLTKGLKMLQTIKEELDIPVLSDIHETSQTKEASLVLDCIQIPAFLARQTDLLVSAASCGKPLNVKKGQFMAPGDMANVIDKVKDVPNFKGISLCERGASFGYHNLVVDMRSLVIMRELSWPVIFDATHSVQLPAASGSVSSGERHFVPALARAAVAVGVDGVFLETHPDPPKALCDGPNQWPLDQFATLIKSLLAIRKEVENHAETITS